MAKSDPVLPSQARMELLSRLNYDADVADRDMASNFEIGPTLTKDEQERCISILKSPAFNRWVLSETSSVLVINGNGSNTVQRKSGMSFLSARLVYSIYAMRYGVKIEEDPDSETGSGTDPGTKSGTNSETVTKSDAESDTDTDSDTASNFNSDTIARPEIVPIHFFCGEHPYNGGSKIWESPSGVANSLLVQLISQCKNLDVSKLKRSRYRDLDASKVTQVLEVFQLLIKQLPAHYVVFCVIDGLTFYTNNDEVSKSARRLVKGLIELFEKSEEKSGKRAAFKLLLTVPTEFRGDVLDDLDEEHVITIPKRLKDTGGLDAVKWDALLKKNLEENQIS
ncbi:hypothetical protein KJ359_012593 [Pestalotiopsis sp. 9143b]|nr:hypothetical protein KJ359_012593 [Pestalotiopsis sp. 9143b]